MVSSNPIGKFYRASSGFLSRPNKVCRRFLSLVIGELECKTLAKFDQYNQQNTSMNITETRDDSRQTTKLRTTYFLSDSSFPFVIKMAVLVSQFHHSNTPCL